MASSGERLSARAGGAEAHAGADRQPPRAEGCRPRGDGDAGWGCRQLAAGANQIRKSEDEQACRNPRQGRTGSADARRGASRDYRHVQRKGRRHRRIAGGCDRGGGKLKLNGRKDTSVLKRFIGNKAYSSWSLRGWLAVKQSGLAFEEIVVPLSDGKRVV